MPQLNCVILAAGKGTRMVSKLPKIAHPIMGKPMVRYVVAAARELTPRKIVVVTGHEHALVEECLRDDNVEFALQAEQKGTAHALLSAEKMLADGDILVLYGDVPLMTAATLQAFLRAFDASDGIAFMTTEVERSDGYGRVIVGDAGEILDIIEDNDATGAVRDIRIINTGICMIRRDRLSLVKAVTPNDKKGEYYLTDICKIARDRGIKVLSYLHGSPNEVLGINTRLELSEAGQLVRNAILDAHMAQGVTIADRSVYIEADVQIASDTVISPYCYITGKTSIGGDTVIGPHVIIKDSVVGAGAYIEGFAYLDGAKIQDGARVPTFTRITNGGQPWSGSSLMPRRTETRGHGA
jgi:bifunctional UDP-N-acetylglucosamine pyrophosphorylase / glucosamine-1-phosphate N-acetyltransferase